jgi:hypothetical protein
MSTVDEDYLYASGESDTDLDTYNYDEKTRMKKKRKSMSKKKHAEINEKDAVRKKKNKEEKQQTDLNFPKELFNLTEDDERRIYEEVTKAMNNLREHVCAVCDKRVFHKDRTLNSLSTSHALLKSMRRKLPFPPNLDKDLCEYYDVSSYSPDLSGIMLSKGGIMVTDIGEVLMSICISCKKSLTSDNCNSVTPPKYAIANGLFIGKLPEEFNDTSKTEYALVKAK